MKKHFSRSLTLTHTHTHTRSHSLTHFHFPSPSPTHSLSASHSHTLTHSLTTIATVTTIPTFIPHFINSLLKAEGGTNSVNRKCNPLRRSCASSARNAGESAICPMPAQPSAEIVPLEYTLEYLGSWKMRTGDLVVQLQYAEYLWSWKMRTGDLVVQLQYAEVTCERPRTCRKKVFLRFRKTYRERHIHTQT